MLNLIHTDMVSLHYVFAGEFLMCLVEHTFYRIVCKDLVSIRIEYNHCCHHLRNSSPVKRPCLTVALFGRRCTIVDFAAVNTKCCCLCKMGEVVMMATFWTIQAWQHSFVVVDFDLAAENRP